MISLLMFTHCHKRDALENLRREIEAELADVQGDFAVAYKNLGSGEMLLINERENFHAASTMKTPVMIEVYKQALEGKLSLHDSMEIKNEFKSIVDGSTYSLTKEDDSELELYSQVGKKTTIASLIYDMITVSSNLATNHLIERVDPRNVTFTMRSLGANDIKVLRGVEDAKAYEKGLNNSTTAYDLMLIFEAVAEAKVVDDASCKQMMKILMDQKFNEIIPAKLPKEVRVAHKTGSITGVQHDSGVVLLPNGNKYVLILLSKNLENETAGIDAMANVSEIIYRYQNGTK